MTWLQLIDGLLAGFLFGRLQKARGFTPRCIYAGMLMTTLAILVLSLLR